MIFSKLSFKQIPGWVYTLLVIGFLYASGLHTEAIAQVQRLVLVTGVITPDLEAKPDPQNATNNQPVALSENRIGADFLLQDLQGNTVKFSSLQNKVIFLNVWATWCPPCIAEMPGIQSLYNKVKMNEDIAFVLLSVDENGLNKVKKFVAKKGYTFPVFLPAGNFPAEFESQSIPTTFILDKTGKIVSRHEGMAHYDTPEVKEYLENLAK